MKRIIIMPVRLLIIILLSVPHIAFAVCAGSSPKWTSADCSNTEIATCITGATNGDTINVPAGACTWTAEVDIPVNKTIKLMGAGSTIEGTRITRNGGQMILSESANSRISGFRFILTGSAAPLMVEARNTGFRIDHNYFDNQTSPLLSVEAASADGFQVTYAPEGLIDHNTFNECRVTAYGMSSYGNLNKLNALWAEDSTIGTATRTVYVEDNIITRAGGTNAMDSNEGSRYVFRYNTVNGVSVMVIRFKA